MAGWCTLHDQPPSAPPWLSPGRWTYSATSRRRGRRRRALRGAAGQPASLTSSSCPRCGGGGGATCHSLGGGRIAMCAPACDMCPPPACMQDLMFLGDFEMAKMRAQQEAKWLMLNLQDSNEFDSHR